MRTDLTMAELNRGMNVMHWNRAQQDPPIDIGRELWVADELAKFYEVEPTPLPTTKQRLSLAFRAILCEAKQVILGLVSVVAIAVLAVCLVGGAVFAGAAAGSFLNWLVF